MQYDAQQLGLLGCLTSTDSNNDDAFDKRPGLSGGCPSSHRASNSVWPQAAVILQALMPKEIAYGFSLLVTLQCCFCMFSDDAL